MENLYLILMYVFYCFFFFIDGYSDGRERFLGTEDHWTKFPQRFAFGLTILFFGLYSAHESSIPNTYAIIAMVGVFWPWFQIGCAKGLNKPMNYIGITSRTDAWMIKWGLVKMEKGKFPIITVTYILLIAGGILLILYSIKILGIMSWYSHL